MRCAPILFVFATTACAAAAAARAEAATAPPPPATATARFAVVVGVNAAPPAAPAGGAPLAPLRYADDDAARWFDLLRSLGGQVAVLTSPDDDTARLHPQAAGEARAPTAAELARVLEKMHEEVARASSRGLATELFFVYAGHGARGEDGGAMLTLEDGALTGADLFRAVEGVGASRNHVVVDACYSYFLAAGRGAGGEARAVTGSFVDAEALASRPNIGLLLSTSTSLIAHEWSAIQAGVFSHEVRSGLLGAADANHDGRVSYKEIAAFVDRANAAIPNERFRPRVYARAPQDSDVLVDVAAQSGHLLIDRAAPAGHWILEDENGVRLADLHNAAGDEVALVKPRVRAFAHRQDDDDGGGVELVIDGGAADVRLSEAPHVTERARARSGGGAAAAEAFEKLFALPFDERVVNAYTPAAALPLVEDAEEEPGSIGAPLAIAGGVATSVGLVSALACGGGALYAGAVGADESRFRSERLLAQTVSGGLWICAATGAAVTALGGAALLVPPGAPRADDATAAP